MSLAASAFFSLLDSFVDLTVAAMKHLHHFDVFLE
jgi:hypothetical protein